MPEPEPKITPESRSELRPEADCVLLRALQLDADGFPRYRKRVWIRTGQFCPEAVSTQSMGGTAKVYYADQEAFVPSDRDEGFFSFRRYTMKKDMIEIRWHGRGGQGAKTACLLLADAAFSSGK